MRPRDVHAFCKQLPRWLALGALCLLMAACAGTEETTRDEPPGPSAPAEEPTPTTRTVEGFRVQILTTSDQSAADAQYEQAQRWWRELPASQRPPHMNTSELPIEIDWKQPYYRVRIGGFAERGTAEAALSTIKHRFPDAFIVPDLVTITQ